MSAKSERNHDDDIGKEFPCRDDDNDLHQRDNKNKNENIICI